MADTSPSGSPARVLDGRRIAMQIREEIGRDVANWVDAGGQPMPQDYLTGKWTAHDGFSQT
ncbi:MAG: hypothetical protein AAFP69_16825, partial [Planctomycetota bacterium]